MKLSANACAHVRKEISEAFADEYNAADKAIREFEENTRGRYERFRKELDEKVLGPALKDAKRLIAKHGLTPADGKDFDPEMRVSLFMSKNSYGEVEQRYFAETKCDTHGNNSPYKKLLDAREAVDERVRDAVSKALFEIEVHGKKDTLETIVAEVVAEIRKGGK